MSLPEIPESIEPAGTGAAFSLAELLVDPAQSRRDLLVILKMPDNRFVDLVEGQQSQRLVGFCLDEENIEEISYFRDIMRNQRDSLSPSAAIMVSQLEENPMLDPSELRRRLTLVAWVEYLDALVDPEHPHRHAVEVNGVISGAESSNP